MSEVDPVKAPLAARLRDILAVDVEFEKLSAEDLQKLLRVVTSIPLMSQAQVRAVRHNFNERVMDKPVRELLKPGVAQKELAGADTTSDSGPFGLGILPGVVKVVRGAEKAVEGEVTEKGEAAPEGSPGSSQP